jgi:hypothetical protein
MDGGTHSEQRKGGIAMLVRRFLFETKLGELLLVLLEQKAGLAVVRADRLGVQRCGYPAVARETE